MEGMDLSLEPLKKRPFFPSPLQDQFRAQLGLPTDTPLVMSGHQPGLWHMGIVAKVLAMHDIATRTRAQPAWVVADQDTLTSSQLTTLRLPTIINNHINEATWDLDTTGIARPLLDAHRPLCLIPPLNNIPSAPELHTTDSIRIRQTLEQYTTESSIAMQFTLAALDLIYTQIDAVTGAKAPRPIVIPATALARTGLFESLFQQMVRDADMCIKSYNEAVVVAPRAKMRPLNPKTLELPVWSLDKARGRVPVHASDLASIAKSRPTQLAPRAILMTQMLRIAGCEVFIHGLGGGEYERIGDAWFSRWNPGIGAPAPWIVTSATVTPTSASLTSHTPTSRVSPASIANTLTLPHRARNNPALLGDDARQGKKQQLVNRINAAKHHAPRTERAALYRELRALVDSAATATPAAHQLLTQIADDAAQARTHQRSVELAHDRTFPFFVYPTHTLHELHRLVRDRVTI